MQNLEIWSATGGLCVVSNIKRNIKHDSAKGGLNDRLTIFFLFVLFMEPLMCRTYQQKWGSKIGAWPDRNPEELITVQQRPLWSMFRIAALELCSFLGKYHLNYILKPKKYLDKHPSHSNADMYANIGLWKVCR